MTSQLRCPQAWHDVRSPPHVSSPLTRAWRLQSLQKLQTHPSPEKAVGAAATLWSDLVPGSAPRTPTPLPAVCVPSHLVSVAEAQHNFYLSALGTEIAAMSAFLKMVSVHPRTRI